MYVKEMQIEVDLSLQKIGANRTRKFRPQEIDWLLNKNQDRFVFMKIRPKMEPNGRKTGGFEILQDDLDAIKALVRRGVKLPAFVGDDRTMRSALPGDYAYLTQDESVIKRISPLDTYPSASKSTLYINAFPISTSQASAAPFYTTVQLTINGNILYDIQSYVRARTGLAFGGYSAADEVYDLQSPMVRTLIDLGFDAYWEYYGDTFKPRNIIVITSQSITGTITIDGTTTACTSTPTTVYTKDAPQAVAEYQANRLTASNISAGLLEVAFFGTQPEFPISEIAGRYLYVYPNKSFIVSNTVISYVRKPRRISLILGTDCELSPEYHQLICDLTVEYIKGMIADPNWEVKLQDNMKRTPLP